MTHDRAGLVEKVAEELWQADSIRVMGCRRSVPWSEAGPAAHNQWRPLATAAIDHIRAEVLEEAAKEADKWWGQDLLAAAIRALKGDSNDV
jgi:hypothetical protein